MTVDRKAILSAAAADIAELGLQGASLGSIASRAGVEAGAVRALFVDVPTLLREMLKEATEPLMSGVALAVEETEDSREVVEKSLRLYDAWMFDHPEIVRVMMRCALDGPDSLRRLHETSLLPSEFYAHLEQLIEKRQLRCPDMFTLTLLFDSLIMFPHMLKSSVELMMPEQTIDETLRIRFNAIVDLFNNGLFAD